MARFLTRPTLVVISPTRPESAKTDSLSSEAPYPGKAAASEGPRLNILTRPTPSCQTSSFPMGYIEGLNDARLKRAGFFSILLKAAQAQRPPIASRRTAVRARIIMNYEGYLPACTNLFTR